MKKEDFIKLYHNLSIEELCKELNCSTTLIYSLLDRYEIPRKNNSFRDYGYLKKSRTSRIKLED